MTFLPPRKRFGQHFLHDRGIVERMLDAFQPKQDDEIVEIGPGRGALTLPLLKRIPRLQVIELDRDLAARLPSMAHGSKLTVHQADVLDVDFAQLPASSKLRLIGNLPYNISTPLLFHLIEHIGVIRDMMFMLQKEVADRLAARPATKEYGRLSVMIQWRLHVERLFDVAPGAFTPPPKVHSSVIRLVPKSPSLDPVLEPAQFVKIVQASFAQRRKTLRNSLRGLLDDPAFATAGIDPTRRPETLTLEEFARLARQSGTSGAGSD